MTNEATLRNSTLNELLNLVDEKRQYSIIIDELCKRLESDERQEVLEKDTNHNVECPICQANLECDLDIGNNMFTISLNRNI